MTVARLNKLVFKLFPPIFELPTLNLLAGQADRLVQDVESQAGWSVENSYHYLSLGRIGWKPYRNETLCSCSLCIQQVNGGEEPSDGVSVHSKLAALAIYSLRVKPGSTISSELAASHLVLRNVSEDRNLLTAAYSSEPCFCTWGALFL